MLAIWLALAQLLLYASAFQFTVKSNQGVLLYDSKHGLVEGIVSNQKSQNICQQALQFYISQELWLKLASPDKPFKVTVRSDSNPYVVSNGLSRSILDPETSTHVSQVIVLNKCFRNSPNLYSYNLLMTIATEDQVKSISLPVACTCADSKLNSHGGGEHIILSFVNFGIYALLTFVFLRISPRSVPLDLLFLPMLALALVHPLFSTVLTYMFSVRGLYQAFAPASSSMRAKQLFFTYTFSMLVFVIIKTFEVDAPLLHFVLNFCSLCGFLLVFRLQRFRHLFYLTILVNIGFGWLRDRWSGYSDFQIYFPALVPNKHYACINISLFEMAIPLLVLVYFVRICTSPRLRNMLVATHMLVFVSVQFVRGEGLELFLLCFNVLAGLSAAVLILHMGFRSFVQARVT